MKSTLKTVTVHEAKTNLSKLLARVEAGEEFLIARNDKPVAKLTRIPGKNVKRGFGSMKGLAKTGPEFFEPLPDAELKRWGLK
jgi:prevent-host-death family protein